MLDRIYDINNIYIQELDGSNKAANEFLDFTVDMTVPEGLTSICFLKWKESVTIIEQEIFDVLAEKAASSLTSLTVKTMSKMSEQVREALAGLVLKIILSDPPLQ